MRARVREVAGIAAAATVAGVVVIIVSAAIASTERTPTTIVAASAIAALPALLGRGAARAVGPRGLIVAALVPLVFVPLIVLVAHSELREPVLDLRDLGDRNSALLVRAGIGMVPVGIVATVACWLAVGRGGLDRAIRGAAPATIALAGLVSLFASTARSRVTAEEWLGRLRVVGHTPHDSYCERELLPDNRRRYERRVNAGVISIECGADNCTLSFIPEHVEQRHEGAPLVFYKDSHYGSRWVEDCGGYYVLLDERHHIYVLETTYLPLWPGDATAAFSDDGRYLGGLDRHVLGDVLAPPPPWVVAAGAGALFAAVLLLVAHRRRSADWIEGRVGNDWAIMLADGTRLPETMHGPGTLVVAAGVIRATTTYRDAAPARAQKVLEGTVAEHRARLATEVVAAAAWALAIVAITSAPLLVFIVEYWR